MYPIKSVPTDDGRDFTDLTVCLLVVVGTFVIPFKLVVPGFIASPSSHVQAGVLVWRLE